MKRLLFLLLMGLAPAALAQTPTVSDAEAREPPPGADRTAAYFTLHNDSDRDCRLRSARSPAAGRVEIHRHRHEGGVMRMRPVDGLDLPPGETVVFEPGGLHLMLLELSAPLASGEQITIGLDFGECGTRTLTVPVTGY